MLRRRYYKVADYSMRLLVRLLILFILIIAALTPLVMFFMAVYEGREISVGQALVFIFQSVATTGYGELLPFYSYPIKITSIFLMVLGVTMIFMIGGTLMTTLIERRIAPRAPIYTDIVDHVVFTNYNEIVDRTIKLLKQYNVPYVVAIKEQSTAIELLENGINCVNVDPSYDDGLRRLGVEKARVVIASDWGCHKYQHLFGGIYY